MQGDRRAPFHPKRAKVRNRCDAAALPFRRNPSLPPECTSSSYFVVNPPAKFCRRREVWHDDSVLRFNREPDVDRVDCRTARADQFRGRSWIFRERRGARRAQGKKSRTGLRSLVYDPLGRDRDSPMSRSSPADVTNCVASLCDSGADSGCIALSAIPSGANNFRDL